MKKISLLLVILIANYLLVSCTAQSLEDEVNITNAKFATEGGDDQNSSGDLPPEGGN